jgi:hypothetical protein
MSGIGIGWDQANWSSHDGGGSDTSHPYYNFPVNIEGYRHPNVVRQILNKESVLGDPISEDTLYARTEYSFEYKYDIATLTDDMKVLVIMHQRDVDPTSGAIFSFVYNIQFTEIGSLQGYD